MKKAVVSLSVSVAALTCGIVGTANAATNPFSDVSADHWAYDAVAQLKADGVIEGYGDDTYRGGRSITRYEMAQMVAKAMSRHPQGTDKALVDRLAAEFSDELNSLGVRVANLERNADMVKWTGELRYIYKSDRHENRRKNDLNRAELRLFPTAEVNDHWKIKTRLTTRVNLRDDTAGNVQVTYAYAEGKYKNFTVEVGKMSNYSTNDDGLVLDDFFSGARLTFGSKLQAVLEAGRWNMTTGNGAGAEFTRDNAANYQGLQLNYNGGKFFGGLGYRHFGSEGFRDVINYSKNNSEDAASVVSVGANYRFDKNWNLSGAFAKNSKADFAPSSHSIKLAYKGAKRSAPNTWGIHAAYRYISKNVTFAPTYETMFTENHRKGWELGVQYVPVKNILADAFYFQGKTLDTNLDTKTLYGRVRWYF